MKLFDIFNKGQIVEPQNNYLKTDEWKQHLSDSAHGKKAVYCSTTNKTFDSIGSAAREYGLLSTNISKVCRGQGVSVKGYKFEFVDKEA